MSQCQVPPVPENLEPNVLTLLSADIDTVTFLSGGNIRNVIGFIGCVLARIKAVVYRADLNVQGEYENVVTAFKGLAHIKSSSDL